MSFSYSLRNIRSTDQSCVIILLIPDTMTILLTFTKLTATEIITWPNPHTKIIWIYKALGRSKHIIKKYWYFFKLWNIPRQFLTFHYSSIINVCKQLHYELFEDSRSVVFNWRCHFCSFCELSVQRSVSLMELSVCLCWLFGSISKDAIERCKAWNGSNDFQDFNIASTLERRLINVMSKLGTKNTIISKENDVSFQFTCFPVLYSGDKFFKYQKYFLYSSLLLQTVSLFFKITTMTYSYLKKSYFKQDKIKLWTLLLKEERKLIKMNWYKQKTNTKVPVLSGDKANLCTWEFSWLTSYSGNLS